MFDEAWLTPSGRRYRLRESDSAERKRHELMYPDAVEPLGDGCRMMTIVVDLGGGYRNHLFLVDCVGMEDPGDGMLECIVGSLLGRPS